MKKIFSYFDKRPYLVVVIPVAFALLMLLVAQIPGMNRLNVKHMPRLGKAPLPHSTTVEYPAVPVKVNETFTISWTTAPNWADRCKFDNWTEIEFDNKGSADFKVEKPGVYTDTLACYWGELVQETQITVVVE